MADKRYHLSMGHGSPGLFAYVPRQKLDDGHGALEAYRLTSNVPHFNIISPLKTLYAPSISQLPETAARLWRARRKQERWLFRSRPDAFMANAVFSDILLENMEMFKNAQDAKNETVSHQPLIAIGQLQDLGITTENRILKVMAMPTGESGELLRIARMDDSQWQWGVAQDAFINMSTVVHTQRECQATWARDCLPIMQVKFVKDRWHERVHRWLLVQKQTSTTLLWPEYRETISPVAQPENVQIEQHLSFIDPRPIMTISHTQTGNRFHSDVLLIPGGSSLPPQLAIVDECGYWIVWNLMASKGPQQIKASLEFHSCGHIDEGLLDEMPLTSSHPSQKHGLLLIGRADEKEVKGVSPPSGQESPPGGAALGDRQLAIWNQDLIEIINMRTKLTIPQLGPFLTEKGKQDSILDVQNSPLQHGHIFILTKHRILWVDVLGSIPLRGLSEPATSKPTILLNCPHVGTKRDNSRMFVCRAPDEDSNTTFVFIYHSRRRQLSIFWFKVSPVASIPQWHRDTISLPSNDGFNARSSIRDIRVDEVQLAISTRPGASSPGIGYHKRGAVFYQLSILWDDLSLQHCMCAVSDDATLTVSAPDTRVVWSKEKQKEWEKNKQKVVRLLCRTFVLSDGMQEDDIEAFIVREGEEETKEVEVMAQPRKSSSRITKPVTLRLEGVCAALQERLDETALRGEVGLPATLFDALDRTLQEGHDCGRLPLLTWHQVAEELPPYGEYNAPDDAMEDAIEELMDQNGEGKIITQLETSRAYEAPAFISLTLLRRYFSRLWIEPVEEKLREETRRLGIWVSELAKDAFLSSHGIMFQDIPVLGPQSEEMIEDSQTLPGSQAIKSSQSLGSPGEPAKEDGAIRRLGALCSGIRGDKLDVSKQSKVLSYWPGERGVDPGDYVSSVARANEELSRGARERLQRIEAKKKMRAEKYKRPASMRQSLPNLEDMTRPPPVQAMSSQVFPESSQSRGMFSSFPSMSQPVSGAWGDRKRVVKKGRRKSGFN